MARKQNRLSTLFLVAAIICLAIGIFPQGAWYTDPETAEQVTEWTLGLRFSPLWRYVKREMPDGSFNWQAGVELRSWSWLVSGVGVACLELWHRRRRPRVASNRQPEIIDASTSGESSTSDPGCA